MKLREYVKLDELFLKTTQIGSLPVLDIEEALNLSFSLDIPAWPQLPKYEKESMIFQFMEGFPGWNQTDNLIPNFSKIEKEIFNFYETYLKIIEDHQFELLKTFSLSETSARAFIPFIKKAFKLKPSILKGQITGPFTLGISLKNEEKKSLIFDERWQDLLVKFITLKALAQAWELKKVDSKVIIFLDEPGLSGFGSLSFITISKDLVLNMINEVVETLQKYNFIVGIHVCANTSWDLVLESSVQILSFDSFNFFDKLIIYEKFLKKFLERGFLAWGLVPTEKETLTQISLEGIFQKFTFQLKILSEKLKISKEEILEKSLFTPSCGLGNLEVSLAKKALDFLKNFPLLVESHLKF
ncbi:MAG: hypothetical protein NZ530_04375 [Thermodesulfobacteriaceae bacterium]|nr:hypothetical protein [Thermodesulfobacteriaceae bacterium]